MTIDLVSPGGASYVPPTSSDALETPQRRRRVSAGKGVRRDSGAGRGAGGTSDGSRDSSSLDEYVNSPLFSEDVLAAMAAPDSAAAVGMPAPVSPGVCDLASEVGEAGSPVKRPVTIEEYILRTPALHEKILMYEEVEVNMLLRDLHAAGVKVSRKALAEYLVAHNVTYRDMTKRSGRHR